ncbi:MAG: rhomboid family intramembrane serine protease [Polyangiaceae bacterium]
MSSEPSHEAPPSIDPAREEPVATVGQFQAELVALTPRVFVTWAFLAANVVVFVAMLVKGVSATDPTIASLLAWGADYAPRTLGGEPWRLVTATFIHIGALHLGMNMLVLGSVGPFVERLLGNSSFFVLYVAAGLAGSVTSVLWSPDVVSAGASGAIFGLYGGLMGFALRNKHSIPRATFIQLVQRAGTFLVINVVYAFSQKQIDMAGHVGGLFGGFLAGLALARPLTPEGISKRWVGAAGVTVATTALVVAVLFAVPRPVDVDSEIAHASSVEDTMLATFKRAADTEDPATVVAAIDKEILPLWDAEIARLEKLPAKGAQKEQIDGVLAAMRKRRADLLGFKESLEEERPIGTPPR